MEENNYRIIVETERGGKKNFYIQKRLLFVFWVYYRRCYDMSMYRYRVRLTSLEEAKEVIEELILSKKADIDSKIVKKEVLIYGK